ncbi:hypothetical protein V6N12_012736 [Hibiscus sabdariffa]|uniref:Uncharacterized protein n=1 Tax=Hibiscus sabdariffa TaxID=183260 RepID=A0ABR2DDL0_9ROSI
MKDSQSESPILLLIFTVTLQLLKLSTLSNMSGANIKLRSVTDMGLKHRFLWKTGRVRLHLLPWMKIKGKRNKRG